MLKTADFKTCARIQPKRGWCFVCKLFLCVFFCLFPIFSFAITLPSGYTELEYIESTGTQYIDTGFVYNNNTRVAWDVQLTAQLPLSSNQGSGVGWVSTDKERLAFKYDIGFNNKICLSMSDTTDTNNNMNPTIDIDNARHLIEIDSPNKMGYVDNVAYPFVNVSAIDNSTNKTLPIFAWYSSNRQYDQFCQIRLYGFKIWDNGTLARDMVPAQRNSDEAVGMYDLVHGVFYTNANTTTYTQLEYLRSDSNQWIVDTTLTTLSKGAYEIKVSDLTERSRFVGFASGSASSSGDGYTTQSGIATSNSVSDRTNTYFPINYSNNGWNDTFVQANIAQVNVLKYEFELGNQKLYVNGTLNKTAQMTTNQSGSYPFRLFRAGGSVYSLSFNGSSSIHYCKVYDGDGDLLREYIPVKDSNNVLGMYETQTGRFLTNAGSGTFIAGANVGTYTPNFIAGPEVVEETYTELEYLDIPANTGFNTNVYLTGNMDIEYEVMIVQRFSDGLFGGARSEKSYGAGFNFPYNYNHPTNGTNIFVDFFGSQNSNGRWFIQTNGSNYAPEENKKYKVSIINKVGTFSVDGTVIDTHTYVADGIPNAVPYAIHASYGVDTLYYEYKDTMRFYHFSATGVADIVPVKRNSDNALGLYNKITGEFLEKIGSGTIIAGPAVAQPATVEIIWGGLTEPDASGMCTYGETFTAPSTAPTAPSGLKFLGWIPR